MLGLDTGHCVLSFSQVCGYYLLKVRKPVCLYTNHQVVTEMCAVLGQVTGQEGGRGKGVSSSLHHMSAQTIFSVLDYLTKWKFLSQQIKPAGAHSEGELL